MWDLLALPPCKPKGSKLTQLSWNLSLSNQDCWQAGTESWQHNKGTLISPNSWARLVRALACGVKAELARVLLRQRWALGPGDGTAGLRAGSSGSLLHPSWLVAGWVWVFVFCFFSSSLIWGL